MFLPHSSWISRRSEDGPANGNEEEEKRKARLAKLAAWRKQQEGQNGSAEEGKRAEDVAPEPAVWCAMLHLYFGLVKD